MKFSIVVHAHQPPDNYDSVFHEALERSYGPFLDLLDSMPDVRVRQQGYAAASRCRGCLAGRRS